MSFYVNLLAGSADRVTESKAACTPAEVLLHVPTMVRPLDVQLLSASVCPGGSNSAVLEQRDAPALVDAFSRLHAELLRTPVGQGEVALDIEFLLMDSGEGTEREVVVLQARPLRH